MTLYDHVADLPLSVGGYGLEPQAREVAGGGERRTTVLALHGDDDNRDEAGDAPTGYGEDVIWDEDTQAALQNVGDSLPLPEADTFDGFSRALEDVDLFPGHEPPREDYRHYRRWAVESAALDLALKQADTHLAAALDRSYDPVRFVVSTRLGDPPTADRVEQWLDADSELEFKLDPVDGWDDALVADLAATGAVRILDLKGQYEGTTVDQAADPELYERVLSAFPDCVVEDPKLTPQTRPLFDGEDGRVSWDAPITGLESIEALPFEPEWLNVKPSRFGTVRSLLESIEYCLDRDVRLYGGGQMELDVGRRHIHALASVFYPDAPNDVAPEGYNAPEVRSGLPGSPMEPPAEPRGLEW